MKSRPSFAFFILLFAATVFAQEAPRDEVLEEIDAELRESERERSHLGERIKLIDARIQLLRHSRKLRTQILEIEKQIERADDRTDDDEVDRLEEKLHLFELEGAEIEFKSEMLGYKHALADLRMELREAGLEQELKASDQLSSLLAKGGAIAKKLFEVYRIGPESDEGDLEEKAAAIEQDLERGMEILGLKLELHWAREEGEEDAVEELEEELRLLGGADRKRPAIDPRKMPQPIRPSEDEIAAAAAMSTDAHIKPLLETHCYACHDASLASGDLDLESLVDRRPLVVHRSHWKNVMQQLKVRSMPPSDEPQPSEKDRRLLVAWLTHAIDRFDYSTVHQPGYEPARRLTHEEYNNTIRDLFGNDLRPADRFPADLTAGSGFENSANSLFIQPIAMERYIGAAESIVRQVFAKSRDRRGHLSRGDPRQALSRFIPLAFRRPATAEEQARFLDHFDRLTQSGVLPETAMQQTLQIILVSPSFLIRAEQDRQTAPDQPFRVSDFELANRLSYFLWASMPDDRLFQLAGEDSLHQPDVMVAQVDRMLNSEKANTLGTLFASQWLGFADLDRIPRDQIDNPWATDSLVQAMQAESAMLFNSLVQENAPIERLINAAYTFVNEELANHYQMDGVKGSEMRRVSLLESPRRGVLGHGSILAVTSYPRRTSPVLRGNWILSTLLGTPPPPPPPNVSEFSERIADNRRLTQRQKLELHRRNPNCYACHSEIDPLGFALERFEWFGRYRPATGGKEIDASAMLPGGQQFDGLAGLQQSLIDERLDDLVEQATRKMLSYALGRQLEYYDEATVQQIVEQVEADGRRIRTLIHAIARSDAFQWKQIQQD